MRVKAAGWLVLLGLGGLVLLIAWLTLQAGGGLPGGGRSPGGDPHSLLALEAEVRALEQLPPLERQDRPLPETYAAFWRFVEDALPRLGMRGRLQPPVEAGRPLDAAVQATEWAGVKKLPAGVVLDDYGSYGALVRFLRALLLQFPAVLETVTYDGKTLTITLWLYGRA